MKRFTLGLFAALLLGGCAESVEEAELPDGKSPAAEAPIATQTPVLPPAVSDPASAKTGEVASIDAERLLASTLDNAKAENKRVIVHLGAPW